MQNAEQKEHRCTVVIRYLVVVHRIRIKFERKMPVSSKGNGLSALGKSKNAKGRDELAICGKHMELPWLLP